MAGDSRLSARFGADTSDFKAGITEINREMKLIETGFKATSSTMDDWSNNANGLRTRMEALTKEIELQQSKVGILRARHEEMAKANGENSVQAQNAQIEFNKESEKLGKLQTELGQTTTNLKTLESQQGKTTNVFTKFKDQLSTLGQQVPALGTAFSLLSNPISIAVAGVGAFAAIAKKSIGETVEYNRQIREMGQVTGLGA
jgi:chromosome segregation ATPase